MSKKYKKIIKEYEEASRKEIWEGIRDNFTFGFLGSTLVVFIATQVDLAVIIGYLCYYSYMGKIVNRPKYVTDLGQLIVFPTPRRRAPSRSRRAIFPGVTCTTACANTPWARS